MTDAMAAALGSVGQCARFFVYLLIWNDQRGKYDKKPVGSPAAASMTYQQALAEALRLRSKGQNATVGLWITAESGLFFLDIDSLPADLEFDAQAQKLFGMFPGAFVEWSSSNRGLHIVGRLALSVHHGSRNEARKLEFYTSDRGIALNIDAKPTGSMDSIHDVSELCAEYFPPRAVVNAEGCARPEWRGPLDDDVLMERALGARQSAAVAFGGKVSLQQLWMGDCAKNSEHDMALASHLAFWTGCDAPRIERLMLRSGLRRPKWRTHRTYLSMTIGNACTTCTTVYQEPNSQPALPVPSTEVRTGDALMQRQFPPVQWAVKGLIPQGTAILSAAPKSGKSWLVLQACIAVSAGIPLWEGREPEIQGSTLYLDLEGNDRRLQERISGLLRSCPPRISIAKFHYETTWPRAQAGVEKLREFLLAHPDCRLVVIDTLATFRDPDPGRMSAYAADYAVGEMLKPLAREFPVAIVLVTHTRKMSAGNAMDKISGTQGLVGGVDNYIILERSNGGMDAELIADGRDIKDRQELALRSRGDGGWDYVGKVADIKRSDERSDVLRALASIGGVGTPRDIRAALDDCVAPGTLHTRLSRMVKAGEILKNGKLYTLISMRDDGLKPPPLPGA